MQFDGVIAPRFNPLAFAISVGATFVARAFSGDGAHLVKIMKEAINHNGYAIVDILQPCVTFNQVNTFKWYNERIYKLEEDYDAKDKMKALEKAMEWGDDGIPVGVIYKEDRESYIDSIPYLRDGEPLIKRKWSPMDAEKFMNEFR
jgi:2-oxoglutarate ferredoxin oxidoreductase subunit beta